MLKRLRTAKATKRTDRASSPTRAVVGLGNPGADYAGTRHNVGFEIVQSVVDQSGGSLSKGPSRVRAMVAQVGVVPDRTLYILANTFMNESGGPVRAALDYYKVPVGDLLVIHDDIDLPFGRLRIQVAGGSGGHNGIRSLERSLGTRDFSRLKVGVGRPPGSQDPADFVLRPFAKKERPEVDLMVSDAADVVQRWVDDRDRAQEMAARRGGDD